ncbi:MAG TPA: SirB2 family protein [Opitutaceae bacterium]
MTIIYQITHVASLIALTGGAFYAFAGSPESRKKVMMITGIASLLMLISGFGMLARLHANQFQPWVIVKLVCWLALSGLAGIGYRKRDKAPMFISIIAVVVLTALYMVYSFRFQA